MNDEYYLPFGPEVKLGRPFGVKPTDEWNTEAGEPIRAAGDGVVVFAGETDNRFYADNFADDRGVNGDVVVLKTDGASAPFFEYLNVGELKVKSNDRVDAGQVLGLTGEENLHTSALPWRFNRSSRTKGRVNPRLYQAKYWGSDALPEEESEVSHEEVPAPPVEPAAPSKRRRRAADPADPVDPPKDSAPVQVTPSEDSAPPAAPVDATPDADPAKPVDAAPTTES